VVTPAPAVVGSSPCLLRAQERPGSGSASLVLLLNQLHCDTCSDAACAVSFPELAVLLVLLKDQDSVMTDTIMGYAALPLANLAPGVCGCAQRGGGKGAGTPGRS
jgi:hypothetical protein